MPATIASPHSSPASASTGAARIDALDWTKGALVLCMIAYHALNYSAFRPLAFQFMPFLPPSFVMIAGFVVGAIYTTRYDLRTWNPHARLLNRGVKLLLLFAIMNVGSCVLQDRNLTDGLFDFAGRSSLIFLSGNGREGIFEVLLPIAYFLLLAPAMLWLYSFDRRFVVLATGGIFILCLTLERFDLASKNLSLLSAGLIGMACGVIPMAAIDRVFSRWLPALCLYALYQFCSHLFGEIYAVQIFGAASSVLLLYTCARHLNMAGWTNRQLVLFGKYSLLAYLAQIALLQAIVRAAGTKPSHGPVVFLVGAATLAALFLAVQAVGWLRRQSSILDGVYKAVFA